MPTSLAVAARKNGRPTQLSQERPPARNPRPGVGRRGARWGGEERGDALTGEKAVVGGRQSVAGVGVRGGGRLLPQSPSSAPTRAVTSVLAHFPEIPRR